MATRLYFSHVQDKPNVGVGSIWQNVGEIDPYRRTLSKTRLGTSVNVNFSYVDQHSVTNWDCLLYQAVSNPLLGGQLISGTVQAFARAYETAAGANARAQIQVRVVNEAGNVTRAYLYGQDPEGIQNASPAEEFLVSPTFIGQNRAFPRATAGGAIAGYWTQDGDRIVVELGFRVHNNVSSAYRIGIYIGDDSPFDLGYNFTDSAAYNPFVDFSANIDERPIYKYESAAFPVSVDLSSLARRARAEQAALTADVDLVTATPARSRRATSALTAELDLGASAGARRFQDVQLAIAIAQWATASRYRTADATVAAEMDLLADSTRLRRVTTDLTADLALASIASAWRLADADLTAAIDLDSIASRFRSAGALFTADADLATSYTRLRSATAPLTIDTDVAATVNRLRRVAAALTADLSLDALARLVRFVSSTSSLTMDATAIAQRVSYLQALIATEFDLTADLAPVIRLAIAMSMAQQMTAQADRLRFSDASLTADLDLATIAGLTRQGHADLTATFATETSVQRARHADAYLTADLLLAAETRRRRTASTTLSALFDLVATGELSEPELHAALTLAMGLSTAPNLVRHLTAALPIALSLDSSAGRRLAERVDLALLLDLIANPRLIPSGEPTEYGGVIGKLIDQLPDGRLAVQLSGDRIVTVPSASRRSGIQALSRLRIPRATEG